MTGVDIIGSLLRDDTDILALVPVERIKAGALPDSIALPSLLIRTVSSVDRQQLKRGDTTRVTERTSVAVRAESYRDQRAVIALVKRCCAALSGDIGRASSVSILNAGVGPDVSGPANSFEQTIDFRVSFDATN